MKYKNWKIAASAPAAENRLVASGMPPLAAAVLSARGIRTREQADAFLEDGLHLLSDSFALRDMDLAARRIETALRRGEYIAVYGDYDVDGVTATCLMVRRLRSLGARCTYYIPDRMEEGYGLNREAISFLHGQGVTLLVTVDCGITALEEVDYARELGMDVVITDHHECRESLPAAAAVVNPHRPDCAYPFPHLAGVGVALKLALALTPPEEQAEALHRYAPLTAIGTVADVVPLQGENRAILRLGLDAIARTRDAGIRMLIREAGLEHREITSSVIGFVMAPRINAAGRMGRADLAAELFLTEDAERAETLSRALCALNRDRQAIETEIYEQALLRIAELPEEERQAIILEDERWHQGVVGIVASRLAEKYACPVFMICLAGDMGRGSCRSFGGFNIFEALRQNEDLLESFGGHALAAGFTIPAEQIQTFRSRLNRCVSDWCGGEAVSSELRVDVELRDPNLLTCEQVEALSLLEPHGAGNPRPQFCMRGLTVTAMSQVGGGRHLKLRLRKHGRQLDAIFFSVEPGETGFRTGDRIDAAFALQINEFRGSRTVQLLMTDLQPGCTQAQLQLAIYERYRNGAPLSPEEIDALTPSREEFEMVWRYLKSRAGPLGLEDTPVSLSKKIARFCGLRETVMRTMICLDVFQERGLITLRRDCGGLRISLCQEIKKVDLKQSPILVGLQQAKAAFYMHTYPLGDAAPAVAEILPAARES